ncbi:hypothetical protein N8072_01405 [bacterium]|nr:hypothetical protein [bacterium]MDB4128604.1 hypothetical protein [bacterium]MDC1257310.1 hypothetical protein [bacterium]
MSDGRKLLDGSIAPEFDVSIELRVITKCPSKYKLLDMETGQVYVGQLPTEQDPYYWKRED